MQPLPDGTYDGIVVDVSPVAGGPGARLELAILGGEHKGEVVHVIGKGLDPDDLEVLGLPATVRVVAGTPSVRLERSR